MQTAEKIESTLGLESWELECLVCKKGTGSQTGEEQMQRLEDIK